MGLTLISSAHQPLLVQCWTSIINHRPSPLLIHITRRRNNVHLKSLSSNDSCAVGILSVNNHHKVYSQKVSWRHCRFQASVSELCAKNNYAYKKLLQLWKTKAKTKLKNLLSPLLSRYIFLLIISDAITLTSLEKVVAFWKNWRYIGVDRSKVQHLTKTISLQLSLPLYAGWFSYCIVENRFLVMG